MGVTIAAICGVFDNGIDPTRSTEHEANALRIAALRARLGAGTQIVRGQDLAHYSTEKYRNIMLKSVMEDMAEWSWEVFKATVNLGRQFPKQPMTVSALPQIA